MKRLQLILIAAIMTMLCQSCLHDDEKTYDEWRKENVQYVIDMEALTENGAKVYTRIQPNWAPGQFVLMKWHNDTAFTASRLKPLYNSTCDVKYHVSTIEEAVDSSYNMTSVADSIYRCQPSTTILGFAIALTNMHIGDSCTVIIPYSAGYGNVKTSKITKPYSTLIYNIKLNAIPSYQLP